MGGGGARAWVKRERTGGRCSPTGGRRDGQPVRRGGAKTEARGGGAMRLFLCSVRCVRSHGAGFGASLGEKRVRKKEDNGEKIERKEGKVSKLGKKERKTCKK